MEEGSLQAILRVSIHEGKQENSIVAQHMGAVHEQEVVAITAVNLFLDLIKDDDFLGSGTNDAEFINNLIERSVKISRDELARSGMIKDEASQMWLPPV